MQKNRLEAFSDGVLAILITIMVLELKVPHTGELDALEPMVPPLLGYVLSFLYIGIYWNNHHHTFHLIKRVSGGVLWANLNLLFWLSLIPVVTSWVGEHADVPWPTAIYGGILLMAGVAFLILQRTVIALEGPGSALAEAVGSDVKGKASAGLYTLGVALAFVRPWIAQVVYALVALMWIVPDRRIEARLGKE